MIRAWRKRRRCAHVHLRGIYGDAINLLNARLMCMDCGALLDGPVVLADWRLAEADKLDVWFDSLGSMDREPRVPESPDTSTTGSEQ